MLAFLKRQRKRFDFYEVGFHGDEYLLQFVDVIIRDCDCFIETGTNVGSTLAYMARNYARLECLSCEPDEDAYRLALDHTSRLSNVSVYNETSQEFLIRLDREYSHFFNKNVLFWLDSHGYGFKWPLREEIAFISSGFKSPYILIDDFKVPGSDCFGYDAYEGQECSLDYIQGALKPRPDYSLYYPLYTEKTSRHHPLKGWGLIGFGHENGLKLPDALKGKIRHLYMNRSGEGENDAS